MKAMFNGSTFEFRACDTKGMTEEQLQKVVDENGHMQYERIGAWLVVKGVGYGWEVR